MPGKEQCLDFVFMIGVYLHSKRTATALRLKPPSEGKSLNLHAGISWPTGITVPIITVPVTDSFGRLVLEWPGLHPNAIRPRLPFANHFFQFIWMRIGKIVELSTIRVHVEQLPTGRLISSIS